MTYAYPTPASGGRYDWEDPPGQQVLAIRPSLSRLPGSESLPGMLFSLNPDGSFDFNSMAFSRAGTALVRTWNGTYVECAAGEARIEGARRIRQGVWSWQLADGTPVHPVQTLYRSISVPLRYPARADSTAYSVGDKVWATVAADGLRYWYNCTTAGTTAGSQPTMPTSGTVVDGTVTWTYGGLYRLRGLLIEPSETNSVTQSRDLTTWSLVAGTGAASYDQVGLTGAANTASLISDTDAAAGAYRQATTAVANDTATHAVVVYIAADATTNRCPEIILRFTNGTAQNRGLRLNTSTGAFLLVDGATNGSVIREGPWWRCQFNGANNGLGNTSLRVLIYPARTQSDINTPDEAATGSVIVGHVGVRLNSTTAGSPIVTSGAAVTRATEAGQPVWPATQLSDTAGTLVFDWLPNHAAADTTADIGLLSNSGAAAGLLYADPDGTAIKAHDGTNTVSVTLNWTRDTEYRVALRWVDAAMQVGVRPAGGAWVWGTEGAYDGGFGGGTLAAALATVGERIGVLLVHDWDLGTAGVEALP